MGLMNEICITGVTATVETLLGIKTRKEIEPPIRAVVEMADEIFHGGRCERVFLYNPDAIAMWIYEKYQADFKGMEARARLKLPMLSVFPPVTPVCFGSMYTGLRPEKHGIRKYEKPVLKVRTLFDDLSENGRKAAVVSTKGDSISCIFLGRRIDYFIFPTKEECNAKAMELIWENRYQVIVLYNGDYDYYMHRFGPEGKRALRALRDNIAAYSEIYDAVSQYWSDYNSVVAFAPDHGCHKGYLPLGNHGINEPTDMNIMHFYGFLPSRKAAQEPQI